MSVASNMPAEIRCPKCPSVNVIFSKKRGMYFCEDCGHEFAQEKPAAPLRVFLSYGHDDNEPLVRRIKTDLEKRGHDVWFDKNDIRPGDNWRRSITEGILRCDRFLSFLSKHSTRDPGVCRDEIAISIGVKDGNIQTILVESEAEVQPPVSISHVQWLDMHDWKAGHGTVQTAKDQPATGDAAWESWYQGKLDEIRRIVESEQSRQFAGEIDKLNEYLKPIKSNARIKQLLEKGFFGRQWLFDAVEEWRCPKSEIANRKSEIPESRLFWITGDPGVGKSAFAAQLTHTCSHTVIAAQFVEWDKPDHRDARRVVRSLAFQLATRLPDYRKLLLTLPEIAELDRKDPAELFDYLLANPLRSVIGGGRDRQLIVIDALDEAGEAGRNQLVEMLARHAPRLPDWLGLVVTSRPESHVELPLQTEKPVLLDRTSDKNIADLRECLICRLASQLVGHPDAGRLVGQILERSEGVMLYIEGFCEDVHKGYYSMERPEEFPMGLGGKYAADLRRYFPDPEKFRQAVRPALRAILAAREPLPVEILQRLFNWEDEELRDFTRTLGSLFPVKKENGCEVIKPYHKSLADWLVDEAKAGMHFVSPMEGHRMLADFGWGHCQNDVAGISPYYLRHLPHHLVAVARFSDFASLLQVIGYVSRVRDEEDIADLLRLIYELLADESATGLAESKSIASWFQTCPEEVLGRLLHERYSQEGLGSLPANMRPWQRLAETCRAAVITQVTATLQLLENVGFCIRRLDLSDDEPITEFDESILEVLAREEHDRWCRERLAEGWVYGPELDTSRKTHNCIVPWSEFREDYRDFDRHTCRHWLVSFRRLGYGVFRIGKACNATGQHAGRGTERGNAPPCDGFLETCARQWHQDYVNIVVSRAARNEPASIIASFATWRELPLHWRERWWRQVAEIIRILKKCSFTILPAGNARLVDLIVFSIRELEELADKEHDRWCRERLADGWSYGPIRDNANKIHNAIVPWLNLPENYRCYDRAFCQSWPELFAKGGYAIRRV